MSFPKSSGVLLQQGAFGDLAEVGVAPEGDQEFSGQGGDTDLSQAWTAGSKAPVVSEAQLASGLLPQPDPGQVDGDATEVSVAGAADAALATRVPALEGRRGQAHEAADLAAVLEASPGELPAVGLGAGLGYAPQGHQTPGDLRGALLALPDPGISLRLEIQKLAMDDTVAGDLQLQTPMEDPQAEASRPRSGSSREPRATLLAQS